MLVKSIMTEKVIALRSDETVKDAVEKFAQNHISGSPVLNERGEILGILSETDILNALKTKCKRMEMIYPSLSMVSVSFKEFFDGKEAMEAFSEIAEMKVAEIMNTTPITIEASKEMGEAIDLMNRNKVNRIPVTDHDIIVGIITRKDVIKGLAQNSH